jgi:hypothetical protein
MHREFDRIHAPHDLHDSLLGVNGAARVHVHSNKIVMWIRVNRAMRLGKHAGSRVAGTTAEITDDAVDDRGPGVSARSLNDVATKFGVDEGSRVAWTPEAEDRDLPVRWKHSGNR